MTGKHEIVEQIIQNPKSQAGVLSATAAIGVDHQLLKMLPDYITIVGGSLGIVLTCMMIVHKWVQIKRDLKDLDQ